MRAVRGGCQCKGAVNTAPFLTLPDGETPPGRWPRVHQNDTKRSGAWLPIDLGLHAHVVTLTNYPSHPLLVKGTADQTSLAKTA